MNDNDINDLLDDLGVTQESLYQYAVDMSVHGFSELSAKLDRVADLIGEIMGEMST